MARVRTTVPVLFFFVVFFVIGSVSGILNPVDFLALQDVRKSLADFPGSTFFSTWDFTSDPCGFSGVFCVEDRVVALTLGDPAAGSPGLIGRLSSSIGKMSALTELSLVPGRVMGSIPSSIVMLSELRFLALSRNFFTGIIPPSISALRKLRTLDISFNQISGVIPPSFPSSITNLILAHNRIEGKLPYWSLSTATSLLRLDLKHNHLSGEIGPLPATLQYLSVSFNNFSGSMDRFVNQLSSLHYLDLSSNKFSGVIPSYVFSFPLTSLQLQRNKFTGMVRPLPSTPMSIHTVDLSYNRLFGSISPAFATVKNLYLNNNKFGGKVPGSFVEKLVENGMQVLYLQHNFLTGIRMSPMAAIPMSTELCLQYNCMIPPVQTPCPKKSGKTKTRPTTQCTAWRTTGGAGSDDDGGDD